MLGTVDAPNGAIKLILHVTVSMLGTVEAPNGAIKLILHVTVSMLGTCIRFASPLQ